MIPLCVRILPSAFLAPPSAPETTSADGESYTVHRMLVGVPEGIEDIVPMSSLPSESNLDFMGGGQCTATLIVLIDLCSCDR